MSNRQWAAVTTYFDEIKLPPQNDISCGSLDKHWFWRLEQGKIFNRDLEETIVISTGLRQIHPTTKSLMPTLS